MREIEQSTAANVMVFMTDSTDHVTGKTGLTLTVTASKDGAAFGPISPTVTERGNGWYNVALTTSHTDTLGDLAFHITGTGADPSDFSCRIVVAKAPASTALDNTVWTNTKAGYIDAAISSRLASVSYTAPPSAGTISTQVWSEATRALTDKAGFTINGTTTTLDALQTALNSAHGSGSWATATGFSTHSAGDVWSVGTRTITGGTIGTVGDKTGYALTSAYDLYHADIVFVKDTTNDEYSVRWFKNGVRQTSGITSPTIQVVKRSDGTDLVASTSMTQIGSTGSYKYDEGTNRTTDGESYEVIATATIDGSARSFPKMIGRDV